MFSYIYSYSIQISQYIIHTFCNIFNTYIFILEKKYFIQLYCCFIILGFLTIFFNRRKHYRLVLHKLFRKRSACQSNIVLNRICGFCRRQKLSRKLRKKGVSRRLSSSNFRDKTNVGFENCVMCFLQNYPFLFPRIILFFHQILFFPNFL